MKSTTRTPPFVVADHPGAFPSGTRVIRIPITFSTNVAVGITGTVRGSFPPVRSEFAYLVQWDGEAEARFCRGSRLRRME